MKLVYVNETEGQGANLGRLECEKIMKAPLKEQRFKFFGNMIYGYSDITRLETDTHVYWAHSTRIPKWNEKTGIYIKNTPSSGCTYDKKTKKFKFWYGKQIMFQDPNMYTDMCKYFGAEWFIDAPNSLRVSVTNSVFARVLQGKINNSTDLIKAVVKNNPVLRKYDIDINRIHNYVEMNGQYNRIQSIADYVDVAKDINVLLDQLSNPGNQISWRISNLISLARMLDRKIDFTWDSETIEKVYDKWTEEVETIKEEWMPLLAF